MDVRKPTIEVIGPMAIHDQACAACQDRKAVLDLSQGRFWPCWRCQSEGWELRKRPKRRWRRRTHDQEG